MTVTPTRALAMLAMAGILFGSACDDLPSTPTNTPTTADLFVTSQLMAGGVTWRSFKVSKGGEIKILFTSLLPEADRTVSVSLGAFDGTTCTPTTTVQAAAGSTTPIITATVQAGDFCIRVADGGSLTKTNDFSITVTIPAG